MGFNSSSSLAKKKKKITITSFCPMTVIDHSDGLGQNSGKPGRVLTPTEMICNNMLWCSTDRQSLKQRFQLSSRH